VGKISVFSLTAAVAFLLTPLHATPLPSSGIASSPPVYSSTHAQPSDVIDSRAANSKDTPPKGLSGLVYSSSTLELFWERINGTVAVEHYEIYRDGSLLKTEKGQSHVDRGLMPSTTYQYQILVRYSDGSSSGLSDAVSLKTFPSGAFGEPDITPDAAVDEQPVSPSSDKAPPVPSGLRGEVYGQKSLEVYKLVYQRCHHWRNQSNSYCSY